MDSNLIYLDNNATTPIAPEVYSEMSTFLTSRFFNPSSVYREAGGVAKAIDHARSVVCKFLGGVEKSEVIFTSGATESNNAAIFGATRANQSRRQIITSSVEHPSVLEVCKMLKKSGYQVIFLPVDSEGRISKRDFVKALIPGQTLLVTLMHANNESGVIFPIDEFATITKETDPKILFHTDATQSLGKTPIDLTQNFANVDLLSFSAHKIHGPKGTGVLFLRAKTPWRPIQIGGHQEGGKRAGTENVAGIVGLGKALELLWDHQAGPELERIRRLRDRLESSLMEKVTHLQVNGKNAPRLVNTLNISCHFIEGEGILYQLNSQGICASSGSACTSGSLEPSHVLRAMNIPFTAVHGSVRFGLSRYTTDHDVDRVVELLPQIIKNLRRISPYWDQQKDSPREAVL